MTAALPEARTLLFVPANRPERCAKALSSAADLICADLEDAVPAPERASARVALAGWLASLPAGHRAGVRINRLASADALRDLLALQDSPAKPAFVMLAKTESAAEVQLLAAQLPGLPLIALVESAAGLQAAPQIATAHPQLQALLFGGADLSADLGCAFAWEPLLHARATLVAASALRGLACLDVPFLDLQDEAGLRAETLRAAALGYTGKAVIHPAQVGAVHEVLRPSSEALAQAQAVCAADETSGGGVVVVNGRMVDRPVVLAARRVLRRAAQSQ